MRRVKIVGASQFVKLLIMKSLVKTLSLLLIFIFSCTPKSDTVHGRWLVERVNFDFDERRNTPEMISQIGKEESNDELVFKNDSVVYIKMLSYDGDYQYMINEYAEISFKNETNGINKLGVLKDGKIYSEQNTAIGKMRVVFVKDKK